MDYKLTVKGLENKIRGVKHFETLKSAMNYVALKYDIRMDLNKEIPGLTRGSWAGSKVDGNIIYNAYAPEGNWVDDVHELEITATNKKECYYDRLVEFVTFEYFYIGCDQDYDNSYKYTFKDYDKEYNFF